MALSLLVGFVLLTRVVLHSFVFDFRLIHSCDSCTETLRVSWERILSTLFWPPRVRAVHRQSPRFPFQFIYLRNDAYKSTTNFQSIYPA